MNPDSVTQADLVQASAATPSSSNPGMPLASKFATTLPNEIHENIHSFLDHPSLLKLSATSKKNQAFFEEKHIKKSLLCFEKCSEVQETLLTKQDLLPCYICLKGLEAKRHFPPLKDNSYELGSADAANRACATCLINTRPEVVQKNGVPRDDRCIFAPYTNGRYPRGQCQLYVAMRYRGDSSSAFWLGCPHCAQVTQYDGRPPRSGNRRRRYHDAMLKGDMCAACYQPVVDQENAERRRKKNALARQRYREKKEFEKKEAERKEAEKHERERKIRLEAEANSETMQTPFLPAVDTDTLMTDASMVPHSDSEDELVGFFRSIPKV